MPGRYRASIGHNPSISVNRGYLGITGSDVGLTLGTQVSGGISLQTLRNAGYIVVTDAPYNADPTFTVECSAGIQAAIDASYAAGKAVWFPSGTYKVNTTIRCYVWQSTTTNPEKKTHQLIGASVPSRPVIKLASSAALFDSVGTPRPVVVFAAWKPATAGATISPPASLTFDPYTGPSAATYASATSTLFNNTCHNIEIDTGGHVGAEGLCMFTAQNSFLGNLRVVATNSNCGLRGSPGRNSCATNIEIEGGKIGFSAFPLGTISSSAGVVITGLKCFNQSVVNVEAGDFVPMTIVGFEFTKTAGGSVFTGSSSSSTCSRSATFIDGRVDTGSGIAFDNSGVVGLYIRNVYITGTTSLIKSSATTTTGSGTWKLINEYCANQQLGSATGGSSLRHFSLLDGVTSGVLEPVKSITNSAASPPGNIVTRHIFSIPQIDGGTYIDITSAPYSATAGGSDVRSSIQSAIDAAETAGHNRVFVPRGIFHVGSPGLVLKANTRMFGIGIAGSGAGFDRSTIYTHSSWVPPDGSSPPIVTTVNNAAGTAFFGFMNVQMRDSGTARTHFTTMEWRVGKNSATACTQYESDFVSPTVLVSTTPKIMLSFTGNGGGRHYGYCSETIGLGGVDSRGIKISGTSQPLHIYGINVESVKRAGEDGTTGHMLANVELTSASNVRLYSLKREGDAPTMILTDCTNVGVYSSGGMRDDPSLRWNQILGASDKILFANILVQQSTSAGNYLLYENVTGGGGVHGTTYPDGISIYHRGTLDDAAMS